MCQIGSTVLERWTGHWFAGNSAGKIASQSENRISGQISDLERHLAFFLHSKKNLRFFSWIFFVFHSRRIPYKLAFPSRRGFCGLCIKEPNTYSAGYLVFNRISSTYSAGYVALFTHNNLFLATYTFLQSPLNHLLFSLQKTEEDIRPFFYFWLLYKLSCRISERPDIPWTCSPCYSLTTDDVTIERKKLNIIHSDKKVYCRFIGCTGTFY